MTGALAGLLLWAWLPAAPPAAALAGALAVALGLARGRPRGFACGLLLACLYADLRLQWWPRLPAEALPEQGYTRLDGHILAPPQRRGYSDGRVRQRVVLRDRRWPRCRLLLSYYGPERLRAGQRWQLAARLKPPWGLANPASFNYQTWLTQAGICATGYIREQSLRALPATAGGLAWHQSLRQRVVDSLESAPLGEAARGLLLALSIGERSRIPQPQWQAIGRLGLAHLFVISGLHVGLVAGIGYCLGLAAARLPPFSASHLARHWLAHGLAMAMACCFAALSGFALPAQRALIMLFCVQISALCLRRQSAARSLLLAAVLINLVNPLASHNPGFWLSFAAVGMIFLLLRLWHGRRGWRLLLRMQLALSLALGVVASQWYGGFGWAAPAANAVAVPLVSLLYVPLSLLALLAVLASGELPPWLGLPYELLAAALRALGEGPLAGQWLPLQPQAWELALAALGLALLLALREAGWRLPGLLLLAPLLFAPRLPGEDMRILVFDVGQGLAVLVETGQRALLYDTGAGDPAGYNLASAVIQPYLRRRGIERLDLLVVSHSDRDHASGVATLLAGMSVSQLRYGDRPAEVAAAQSACRRGSGHRLGRLRVSELHPPPGDGGGMGSDNERSCVLMLELAGFRALFPGDIGRASELELVRRYGEELRADLLLVPHHGSGTSSSGPFLRSVAPELAVVSAGFRNHFNHPREDVVARYRRFGIELLETSREGAIELYIRGGELASVRAFRAGSVPHWL